MSWAVIDPYLLYFDDARGLKPVDEQKLEEFIRILDKVGANVPSNEFYWAPLWNEFAHPLADRMKSNRIYRRHLEALRWHSTPIDIPKLPSDLSVTGFREMFGGLGQNWVEIMQVMVTACALTADTILLTRLLPTRNAKSTDHQDYANIFVEKICWELIVDDGVVPSKRIPCVCSMRNLEVPWTCRYDDCLPAHDDGGKCPFYPIDNWNHATNRVTSVHKARPTWRDDQNLFWGEPRAQQHQKAYHWDAYLDENPSIKEKSLGKSWPDDDAYINIAKWRSDWSTDGQGKPGDVHHSAGKKVKKGWRR